MDPLLMDPAQTAQRESVTMSLRVRGPRPSFTCYVEQGLQPRRTLSVDGVDRNRLWKPAGPRQNNEKHSLRTGWFTGSLV